MDGSAQLDGCMVVGEEAQAEDFRGVKKGSTSTEKRPHRISRGLTPRPQGILMPKDRRHCDQALPKMRSPG